MGTRATPASLSATSTHKKAAEGRVHLEKKARMKYQIVDCLHQDHANELPNERKRRRSERCATQQRGVRVHGRQVRGRVAGSSGNGTTRGDPVGDTR